MATETTQTMFMGRSIAGSLLAGTVSERVRASLATAATQFALFATSVATALCDGLKYIADNAPVKRDGQSDADFSRDQSQYQLKYSSASVDAQNKQTQVGAQTTSAGQNLQDAQTNNNRVLDLLGKIVDTNTMNSILGRGMGG